MQFLYPYFLWALTALSVPIIIHLFNFRRTIKVYFSSLRFLRMLKEDNQSKLRLKHYLMLLFRLLFIACLVLAFSQPYQSSSIDLSNKNRVSIYLDNSMSMSMPSDNGSDLFSEAVGSAQEIIKIHAAGTQFRIITNGLEPFSSRFISKVDALDLLTSLKLGANSRSIKEVLQRYAEDEVFYVLSDFQKRNSSTLELETDSTQALYLIPYEYTNTANLYIDSVYLDRPMVGLGQKTNIMVKLGGSNEAYEEVSLKLNLNQQQLGALALSTSANVSAEFVLEENGDRKQGLVVMEEYPVVFDNEFYFALGDSKKIKIAEIKEADGTTPIGRVFAGDVFSFRSFKSSNIEYSTLLESDLIVINGLANIDKAVLGVLIKFSQDGGRLLLIPNKTDPIATFSSFLGEGITLNTDTSKNQLATLDFGNPFYRDIFEEKQANLNMPWARPVVNWKASSTDLLQTRSAYPFLAEWAGSSNIFLLASPLLDQHTDFHLNALFVPIMQQLAFQSLKGGHEGLLFFNLDQSNISLALDSTFAQGLFKLKRGDEELIPTQQLIENRLLLELPNDQMAPGYYELFHENTLLKTLAFNYPKEESILDQFTAAELEKSFENQRSVKVFDFKSVENLKSEMNTLFIGQTYWKHFVVLALIFLLAEILVARFL